MVLRKCGLGCTTWNLVRVLLGVCYVESGKAAIRPLLPFTNVLHSEIPLGVRMNMLWYRIDEGLFSAIAASSNTISFMHYQLKTWD